MKTRKATIRTGIANQVSGAQQKFIEIETTFRRYVLQEGEPNKYNLSIFRRNEIYEFKGPFSYQDGLGKLLSSVLFEEGINVPTP